LITNLLAIAVFLFLGYSLARLTDLRVT
jgi:hypothetical protein